MRMVIEVVACRHKVVTTVGEKQADSDGLSVDVKDEKPVAILEVPVQGAHLAANGHIIGEQEGTIVT